VLNPEIAGPALEKEHADDLQYAQLVKSNVWTAPIHSGLDGGMNRVFLAQVGGSIPPARVAPPTVPGALPPQPAPVAVAAADNGGSEPGLANKIFGGFFGSKTQVAATDAGPAPQLRGSEPAATGTAAAPKARPHAEHAVAEAKPKAESHKSDTAKNDSAKSQPQQVASKPNLAPAQQEANAAAPSASATMGGAQPVVPSGNFDSRWGGLQ
jgi:hypothetical protein